MRSQATIRKKVDWLPPENHLLPTGPDPASALDPALIRAIREQAIRDYKSERARIAGKIGGRSKSKAKKAASRRNVRLATAARIVKAAKRAKRGRKGAK